MARKLSFSLRWCLIFLFVLSGFAPISRVRGVSADSPNDVVIVPAGDPIQIAFASWFDPGVPYQDYMDAFDMAVEDYGSINGFSIQRNNYNAGCDLSTGVVAGNEIITNTQNLGVVGPYCSYSTIGMASVLETAGVVMISYSNTFPDLGGYGWTIFNRTVVADPGYLGWDAKVSEFPSVLDWSADFHTKFGRQPTSYAKYAYDATTLLLARIDEVSALDPSNNLLVDRFALASAVRNTSSFMGITGLITLETDGDRINLLTGKVTVPAGEPIQIAFATWEDAGIPYQDYKDAFDMAVVEYGPIKGFTVQRNDFDAGCDTSTGKDAGNEIITNTQNLGVVGPYCSASTRGLAPVLEMADVVMISYSNTAPDLSGNYWYVFHRTVVADPGYLGWNAVVSELPSVLTWSDDFNTNYGRFPSEFAKYVYDATILLLTRIDIVSTLDGSNNLLLDRADLTMAVRNTSSFTAVTGDIALEYDGDRVNLLTSKVTVPAGEPIQIAFATWENPGVPYQDYMDAFDMAVEKYGPIKGFAIQRNDFDAGCSTETGEIAGDAIITNTQNLGVVGPFCSGSTRGMAPVLEKADVVMISYSNTAADLSKNYWYVFHRTVVEDPEFARWTILVSALPSVIAWSDDFNAKYGRQPSEFAKYVYDATTLLLTRIDDVSTVDPNNNLLLDRADLTLAVRYTDSFMGVTGLITLEPDGDRVNLLNPYILFIPVVVR